jgi:hypothetical protein
MNRRAKIVSSFMIVMVALIINFDTFCSKDLTSIVSHLVHCITEGVIILMFSREMRGERWMS